MAVVTGISSNEPEEWGAALAEKRLHRLLGESSVEMTMISTGERVAGRLYIGEWAAIFIDENALGCSPDGTIDSCAYLRYADFDVARLTVRPLRRQARLRFGDDLELDGPRKVLSALHGLWLDDAHFGGSTYEMWA